MSSMHVLRVPARAKAVIERIDIDLTPSAVTPASAGPFSGTSSAAGSGAATSGAVACTATVIVLSSDDEEVAPAPRSDDKDFCFEISQPPTPLDVSFTGSTTADADAELSSEGMAFVGSRGRLCPLLPHRRSNCPNKPFIQRTQRNAKRTLDRNGERCEHCWCYVCDVVAANCPQWESNDTSTPAHCNAHDRCSLWKRLRKARQRELQLAPAAPTPLHEP